MRSVSVTEKCPRIWSMWEPLVNEWIWNRLISKIFVSARSSSLTSLTATQELHGLAGGCDQWRQTLSQWICTSVHQLQQLFSEQPEWKGWTCTTVTSQNGPSGSVGRTTCRNCSHCCHSTTEGVSCHPVLKSFSLQFTCSGAWHERRNHLHRQQQSQQRQGTLSE